MQYGSELSSLIISQRELTACFYLAQHSNSLIDSINEKASYN